MEERVGRHLVTSYAPRIPPELANFVSRDSYSLLIKGAAGTGKTALALSVIRNMERRGSLLYICTRTSPSGLVQDHPWLQKSFDVSPRPRRVGDEAHLEDLGIFADGRLDEPTALFERITDELMDAATPTIVVDSWDAVGDVMGKEAYFTNTKVLQTWMDRSRARLILLTENPDDKTFDFLIDGVVTLRRWTVDGRLMREMHLSKLLGTEIAKPSYFYTLKGSVFRCFGGLRTDELEIAPGGRPERPPLTREQKTPDGHRLTTGYTELDAVLGGGFPGKSLVSLEVDRAVDPKVAAAFVSRIASNHALRGYPVGFGLIEHIDPNYLKRLLRPALSPSAMELVSFWPDSGLNSDAGYSFAQTGITAARLRAFEKTFWKARSLNPLRHPLLILAAEFQDSKTGGADDGARMLRYLASRTGALVLVRGQSDPQQGSHDVHADVRLRMMERRGTVFLRSDIPWSKFFAISFSRISGAPFLELEPIV